MRAVREENSFTSARQLQAYARLIHAALIGDRTLSTRADALDRKGDLVLPITAKVRQTLTEGSGG